MKLSKNNIIIFSLGLLIVVSTYLLKTTKSNNEVIIELNEENVIIQPDNSAFLNKLKTGESSIIIDAINNADDSIVDTYVDMANEYAINECDNILSLFNNSEINIEQANKKITDMTQLVKDAQYLKNIQSILKNLNKSDAFYQLGEHYYNEFLYEYSLDNLLKVIKEDHRYDDAQMMIDKINSYNNIFIVSSEYEARSPYNLTFNDNYLYFPYSIDNNHFIAKYNTDENEAQIIPVVKSDDNISIKAINVIGEYVFFIAGIDISKGIAFDNAYCIYMMRDDGSELKCVKKGNFSDLYYYNNAFYAISNQKGLLKYDIYFQNEKAISEGLIHYLYPRDDGVYYIREDIDGSEHTNYLMLYQDDEYLTLYHGKNILSLIYEDKILFTRYAGPQRERLMYGDLQTMDPEQTNILTVNKVLGKIGDSFIMKTAGYGQQSRYARYNIKTNDINYPTTDTQFTTFTIFDICEQSGTILIHKENNTDLYIINDIFYSDNAKQIKFTDLSTADFDTNTDIFEQNNVEFYTENEIVIIENDYWLYKSNDLCIYIDKYYNFEARASCYVSHVITQNPNILSIGYSDEPPGDYTARADVLARINKAIFAVNGDFWAEDDNEYTGIVIRDGEVYKQELQQDMIALLPNGGFACYDKVNNPITLDELLDMGVENTISFGPVLLDDGDYGNLVDRHFLSWKNPRTAMGMVNPYHYVFITAEGRGLESVGMTLRELADMFINIGCDEAYNLDGGQSISLIFMGEFINDHEYNYVGKSYRPMTEIIYAGTTVYE